MFRGILLFATLGFIGAGTLRVDAQVPQTIVLLTGTELRQNETVDKNGVTTIKAPTRLLFSAATLLEDLAKDETTNGTWFAKFDNKVPAGAKLKVMYAGDLTNIIFEVVHGDDVVGVSNILSAAPADANYIADVGFIDATGTDEPPYYSIIFRRYTITYDARPVADTLHFTVTGMATADLLSGKPNAKGIYTEGEAFALGYGSGGGVDSTGTPFLLESVNIAATGKHQFILQAAGFEYLPDGEVIWVPHLPPVPYP